MLNLKRKFTASQSDIMKLKAIEHFSWMNNRKYVPTFDIKQVLEHSKFNNINKEGNFFRITNASNIQNE